VRAQAGVVKDQLNAYLKPHGYFFSPDLSTSNRATLGGMVNTDASGQGSLVYGKTSDHVLGLKAVLENGDIMATEPVNGARLADKLALESRRGRSIAPSIASAASGAPTSRPPSPSSTAS
jgi:FAD/FMN-containing dehydrogenase